MPLTPRAREKMAFATSEGLYHYQVSPVWVYMGPPATFQRLMDRVLRPHRQYAAAYLDDIVIHSQTWEEHGPWVEAVMQALRDVGLTANPTKWPARPGGGTLSGTRGRKGVHQTPDGESGEPNHLAAAHYQETGEDVSGVGGLLPAVHPELR